MPYLPALDGLRALAVMLVFLFHTGHAPGGWVGVDIFFVLSGYLITSILLTEHERTGVIRLRHFYIRRACRLLPALVVVVSVVVATAIYSRNKVHDTEIDALQAFIYVLNYHYALMLATDYHDTPLTHLWSLSVEEQFYILWPLLLTASLSAWNRIVALRATLVFIMVIAAWRIFLVATRHSAFRIYFAFDTRADELLIGCALGLWQGRTLVPRFQRSIWLIAASLLTLVVMKLRNFEPLTSVSYPLIGASAACFIMIATSGRANFVTRIFSLSPIVALGRVSYGFYLWHLPIIMIITDHLASNRTALAFLLTLAAATTSYWFIERPFIRLKFIQFGSRPEVSSTAAFARLHGR